MGAAVFEEGGLVRKSRFAHTALVLFRLGVDAHVSLQTRRRGKHFGTQYALDVRRVLTVQRCHVVTQRSRVTVAPERVRQQNWRPYVIHKQMQVCEKEPCSWSHCSHEVIRKIVHSTLVYYCWFDFATRV